MIYLVEGKKKGFTFYSEKDYLKYPAFYTILDFLKSRGVSSLDLALEDNEYLFEINASTENEEPVDWRKAERIFTKNNTFERVLKFNPFVDEKHADCYSIFFVDTFAYPAYNSVMKVTKDDFRNDLKSYWEFKMALKTVDYDLLAEQGVDDKIIIQAFVNEDLRFFPLTENIIFLLPKNVDKIEFAKNIGKENITKPLDCAKFLKAYPEKGIEMVFSYFV